MEATYGLLLGGHCSFSNGVQFIGSQFTDHSLKLVVEVDLDLLYIFRISLLECSKIGYLGPLKGMKKKEDIHSKPISSKFLGVGYSWQVNITTYNQKYDIS